MTKKLIGLFIVVLAMMLGTAAYATDIIESGECGESATYTLDSEGTLIIDGTGSIALYRVYHGYWSADDLNRIKKIIINEGITEIDSYAFVNMKRTLDGSGVFSGCSNLESIMFPKSLQVISDRAFIGCTSLKRIDFPINLKTIGDFAFRDCESMADVNLPDGLEEIGSGAFEFCKSIKEIAVPDGVTELRETFMGCTALSKIKLPDNLVSIGYDTFYNCSSLAEINIPPSVTSISGNGVFCGCSSLSNEIVIPNGVDEIGGYMFSGCTNIPNIVIPDSVTKIGDRAFENCEKLQNINIPGSIESIGDRAFYGCGNITRLEFYVNNAKIGNGAFKYCNLLESIIFNGDISVFPPKDSFSENGIRACFNLKYIVFNGKLGNVRNDAFDRYASEGELHIYYTGTKEEWHYTGNDLDDVIVHYNSTGPSDEIIPLKVNPITPSINVETNTVAFPVTVSDSSRAEELNEVELYVAEYDESGRLVGVSRGMKSAVEGDTIMVTAGIPETDNYKFMLWDGNNAPLMDAVTNIYE